MNLRYATVRKYAKRELISGNFQHAVFGARLLDTADDRVIKLAETPAEIVYFLDDISYQEFIELICKQFPNILEICAVHR